MKKKKLTLPHNQKYQQHDHRPRMNAHKSLDFLVVGGVWKQHGSTAYTPPKDRFEKKKN